MALQFPATRRAPDRSAALAQYRRRAPGYDTELALFEPIRSEAIARLALHRGDTVLDVGCGTGLSFEPIHERVGRTGRIVGIEQCPEMLARAQARVDEHHWRNVDLVCAPAATARIPVQADAALFHFTHDVLRERAALANVLSHLKRGARVVASGLQWGPAWAWPTNGFVLLAAMYSVTSFDGLGRPWDMLARRLIDVDVRSLLFGGIYIASGVYSPDLH
ncbi:MAG: class I SAM-dependent methyltransferase [Ramlibacter sp.]|nr:class I SAM-dependent methyltransferase [Ramlibacter sp.]